MLLDREFVHLYQNLRNEQYGFVNEENTNITMVDFITALDEKYSILRFVEGIQVDDPQNNF